MRVSRSLRHREQRKHRRRILVSMTSALSIATVGVSHIPDPTYALLTSTAYVTLDRGQSFSALSVFPATIQEMVKTAQAASNEAGPMMTAQQSTEIAMVFSMMTDEIEVFAEETVEVTADQILLGQIEELSNLIDSKRIEECQMSAYLEKAIYNETLIWEILVQLQRYDRQYTDEAIRQKLLLDMALHDVRQCAAEASAMVTNYSTDLIALRAEIEQLEEQLAQLQLELEVLQQEIAEQPDAEENTDLEDGEIEVSEDLEDPEDTSIDEKDESGEVPVEDVEDEIVSVPVEREVSEFDIEQPQADEIGPVDEPTNLIDENIEEAISKVDPTNDVSPVNDEKLSGNEVGSVQVRVVYGTHSRS